MGTIKSIGRIYQQTFLDTYSKLAFVKLYDRKNALVAADLLNDRVLPFLEEQNVPLLRVLTDRGTEFCGNRECHEYQLYLAVENIDTPDMASLTECLEASDFVGNAALSRENGISAQKFIERMQQDFTLIHAFPQELRWFVHDLDDELYLLGATRDVFERPEPPEEHRRAFLESCFARMTLSPTGDHASPEPPHGNSVR